jgi:hypothetical protein
MKWQVAIAAALLLQPSASLAAQDLFLRPDRYFAEPGGTITAGVFNGTFSKSEIAVAKDRLADVRLVSLEGVAHPDISDWDDQSDTTMSLLQVHVGASGTYVIGASVQPRDIMVEAKDFDAYLATNGVADVLEARRKAHFEYMERAAADTTIDYESRWATLTFEVR